MGLDMYLEGRRYIWDPNIAPAGSIDGDINTTIQKMIPNISGFRVKGVTVELMYWRKANAIHRWFVDNCQDGTDDCRDALVSKDQLIQLRNLCQQVIANPETGPEFLPTMDGFFFGRTEHDEYYIKTICNTAEVLTRIIDNPEFDSNWDLYYHSSW